LQTKFNHEILESQEIRLVVKSVIPDSNISNSQGDLKLNHSI